MRKDVAIGAVWQCRIRSKARRGRITTTAGSWCNGAPALDPYFCPLTRGVFSHAGRLFRLATITSACDAGFSVARVR